MKPFVSISEIVPSQSPHALPRLLLATSCLQTSKAPFACVNLDNGDLDADCLLEVPPQSSLYAERDALKTSVKYIINLKAYTQPASIIEHLGTDLLRRGRRQDPSRWIKTLREEIVEDDP